MGLTVFINPFSFWAEVVKPIHGDKAYIGNLLPSRRSSIWIDILRSVFQLRDKGFNLL